MNHGRDKVAFDLLDDKVDQRGQQRLGRADDEAQQNARHRRSQQPDKRYEVNEPCDGSKSQREGRTNDAEPGPDQHSDQHHGDNFPHEPSPECVPCRVEHVIKPLALSNRHESQDTAFIKIRVAGQKYGEPMKTKTYVMTSMSVEATPVGRLNRLEAKGAVGLSWTNMRRQRPHTC